MRTALNYVLQEIKAKVANHTCVSMVNKLNKREIFMYIYDIFSMGGNASDYVRSARRGKLLINIFFSRVF